MSQDAAYSKGFKAVIINLFLKNTKDKSCLQIKGKYDDNDSKTENLNEEKNYLTKFWNSKV